MSRWRCQSCEGEYQDTMRDGMQYFHVCPREDSPTADGPQHPGEDHRDERPLPGPDAPAGSIRAEGAGRELLEV